MCHPEVPPGTPLPAVRTEEAAIAVEGGDLPALLALPERTPAAAVLVVNDVFGRVDFYEHLTRRLAQAGLVALCPEYFFREGPLAEPTREAAMARRAKLDGQRTLRDLYAALEWLRRRPEVRGGLGTIGFCMGGTFVLDLAATDEVAATVSYYGFPVASATGPLAAPQPVDLAERMRGAILGHWGDQDSGVGMENVERLRGLLEHARVQHEFHIYPGLGHGFLKAFLDDDGAPGYAQACESWKRTLDFYRRHLTA